MHSGAVGSEHNLGGVAISHGDVSEYQMWVMREEKQINSNQKIP